MTSVMLDIETLGTIPGSVILSVGAVAFDPYGKGFGETFYENVHPESCRRFGMTQDSETAEWWSHPDRESVRAVLYKERRSIVTVMEDMASFFKTVGGVQVWGHGSCFDVVLVEEAMRRCGVVIPWKFRDVRDTRTLFDYSGFDAVNATDTPKREGVHHHALDDCKYQVRCVQHAVSLIRGPL
jgi:hypothetical protein